MLAAPTCSPGGGRDGKKARANLWGQHLLPPRHACHARPNHLEHLSLTESLQERIELICRPSELYDIGGRPNVNDLASKDFGRALHFIALLALCAHLDQQSVTLNMRALRQIHHLNDVYDLVELLCDLLHLYVIAGRRDG